MTVNELEQQQLKQFREICEKHGIKITHQRLEIFRELMSSYDHPSVELIHRNLQKRLPTLAIDTVYRTLATFDDIGLVKKLHFMGDRTLFDANVEPHHHFICDRCKVVKDIYWPEFDNSSLPEEIVSEVGSINERHIELYGLCRDCREKGLELSG